MNGARLGVVGWPIEHSLSPALHRAAYRELGLDWTFDALPVESGRLGEFVVGLDSSWRGLAVTMPHKEALLSLGEPDQYALMVGAGNTLVLGPQPKVFNTDVSGIQVALQARGASRASSAVIVGAGATARSTLVALSGMGLRQVCVQTRSDNGLVAMSRLAARLGVDITFSAIGKHDPCDLLVSTLPAHAADAYVESLIVGSHGVFDVQGVLDVIYDPWPSALIEAATNKMPVITGIDMLAGQAVRQIELFTGTRSIGFDALLRIGLDELRVRGVIDDSDDATD